MDAGAVAWRRGQPNRSRLHQSGVNVEVAVPVRPWTRDADLVVRAQHGDLAAFEELVRHRLDRLFRTACGILGNPAEAEDATQEACIAAWKKLPTLREADRLDAWLGRILLNACRMHMRSRARVREIALDDERSTEGLTDPGRMSERAEEVDLVNRALDTLSADDRALLVLHHVHHERVDSIAATLGIPAGTVKWRLSRARRAVQLALEGGR
jgi:RNA polymerase sigma-70 factor (ECF subfamily)